MQLLKKKGKSLLTNRKWFLGYVFKRKIPLVCLILCKKGGGGDKENMYLLIFTRRNSVSKDKSENKINYQEWESRGKSKIE